MNTYEQAFSHEFDVFKSFVPSIKKHVEKKSTNDGIIYRT